MEPALDTYRRAYLTSVKDDVSTELSAITFEVTKLRQRAEKLAKTLQSRIDDINTVTNKSDPTIAQIYQYKLAAGTTQRTLENTEAVIDQASDGAGVTSK